METKRQARAKELIKKWEIRLTTRNGREGILFRKGASKKLIEEFKELKVEITAEIERQKIEVEENRKRKELEKQKEQQKEQQAIKNGEKEITLKWFDGEYLSGYQVFGQAGVLLEEIGLARHIDGWGYHVKMNVTKTLGEVFTFAEAVEYARPALEEKERNRAAEEAALQAKFDKARTTGKPVQIRNWAEPCNDPLEECSTDNCYCVRHAGRKCTEEKTAYVVNAETGVYPQSTGNSRPF